MKKTIFRAGIELGFAGFGRVGVLSFAGGAMMAAPLMAQQVFTPGNLVVTVEGCGAHAATCTTVTNGNGTGSGNSSVGGYGDNQAAPLTLFQYEPVGTSSVNYVSSFVLPQTANGANLPVSGEYGSSSEGTIQLSGSGKYLTVMGYGVSAAAFNANPFGYTVNTSPALGQSGSLTGQAYTPVPRVVALIDSTGAVNSATALTNVFDQNNPRSAYTVDGSSVYVSGQGNSPDQTGGVFYSVTGAANSAPTAITGDDTTSNTLTQDTRDVQILNGSLLVSVDSKEGSGAARSYVGTLGTAGTPPTTTVGGPVMLTGFGNTGGTGKVTITTGANGTGNGLNAGLGINVSPENYYFANAATLYVADSGDGKQTSGASTVGDGGLQKWVNTKADGSGTWNLAYTLASGLNLVVNTNSTGATGLYGLAGAVSGASVQLYATDYRLSDLDQTHLYGISDTLSFTTASQAANETFTLLDTAPADSNFKGVSFTPTVVTPSTPTITWASPAAITYGSALSSTQLDATASVAGTFTYSPAAGTVLAAGANQTLSTMFTPTDTTDYAPTTATTTITVNPAATTPANLVVTKVLSRTGGNVVVQLTVANAGGTTATNVVVTSVKVGADTATPLPVALGTIAGGASAAGTVSVPGTVGASGAASSLVITGTYAGSTFSSSARITLP